MAKIDQRARVGSDDALFEEKFLLAVQVQIQKLLNEKGLKYRDLSKLLGVSEARISQMLGDDAINLTIRTVARIFNKLQEEPLLLSRRALEAQIAAMPAQAITATWTMLANDARSFEVAHAEIIQIEEQLSEKRFGNNIDWLKAGQVLTAQAS